MLWRGQFKLGMIMALVGTGPAFSHGLWLDARPPGLVVSMGHSDRLDPFSDAQVTFIGAQRFDGSDIAITRIPAPEWTIQRNPDVAAITMSYRGAVWGQAPDGTWIEGARGSDPRSPVWGRFDKYLTTLLKPGMNIGRLATTRLQILPLSDPLTLKRSDLLSVRVLFDGKPLVGAGLAPDYANNADVKSVVTDANGVGQVRIQNQGLNTIGVTHYEQIVQPAEVDFIEHIAILSFGLRPISHWPGWLNPMTREAIRAKQKN